MNRNGQKSDVGRREKGGFFRFGEPGKNGLCLTCGRTVVPVPRSNSKKTDIGLQTPKGDSLQKHGSQSCFFLAIVHLHDVCVKLFHYLLLPDPLQEGTLSGILTGHRNRTSGQVLVYVAMTRNVLPPS